MLRSGSEPNASPALLAAAAISLAAFLALAVVSAHGHFFGLDDHARRVVHLTKSPLLDPALRGVSHLGDNSGLIPLIALGSALLWRSYRRWALALAPVMAGTGALQFVAKWAIDRPRPNLAAWGFPSGHVLSLVVFCGLLAYLLCTSTTGRGWRCLGSLGCALTVLTVGWSRLYLEMHWISDVVGGFMLGLAYLLLAIWLVETATGARASGALAASAPVTVAASEIVSGFATAESAALAE